MAQPSAKEESALRPTHALVFHVFKEADASMANVSQLIQSVLVIMIARATNSAQATDVLINANMSTADKDIFASMANVFLLAVKFSALLDQSAMKEDVSQILTTVGEIKTVAVINSVKMDTALTNAQKLSALQEHTVNQGNARSI